jgi:hypothetical protein
MSGENKDASITDSVGGYRQFCGIELNPAPCVEMNEKRSNAPRFLFWIGSRHSVSIQPQRPSVRLQEGRPARE